MKKALSLGLVLCLLFSVNIGSSLECDSHDDCYDLGTDYFCNQNNECENGPWESGICSEHVTCEGCGPAICASAMYMYCVEDEISGDGISYCVSSDTCSIEGNSIWEGSTLCNDNTAYFCEGYGIWDISECSEDEICIEGSGCQLETPPVPEFPSIFIVFCLAFAVVASFMLPGREQTKTS